ncbi:MAG: hypothetical protein CMN00_02675 [Rickettsiales bacterium]|nr:hypothetical protein [Rickettsiales bacterium]|tara:strand:- start:432 stop:623 length:192 start_codon:yes stop_codon:yes gene_type:complete
MSNTINWFREDRVDRRLLQLLKYDKEQDYYEGKLTPEEEAEMIAFLDQYTDKDYDNLPAGAQA